MATVTTQQRISLSTLVDIATYAGYDTYDVEVSQHSDGGGFSFRFGYWDQVDVDALYQPLPSMWKITENLIDEDDDCGKLYSYSFRYGETE